MPSKLLHSIAAAVLLVFTTATTTAFAADAQPRLKLEDLGVKTQANPELQAQRDQRASMLSTPQTMAFVTWGLMGAAVLLAEKAKENNVHQYVGTAAGLSYFTTAYFSMLAPDPDNVSGTTGLNIKIHKALRWVHLPLMLLLPFAAAQAQHQTRHHEPEHGLGQHKGAIGAAAFAAYTLAGSVMLFEF
jgi:hypothetical protein